MLKLITQSYGRRTVYLIITVVEHEFSHFPHLRRNLFERAAIQWIGQFIGQIFSSSVTQQFIDVANVGTENF